jgi:transposase, IS30 family
VKNHTKLGQTERDLLAQWKLEGHSNGECARRLGRHESTIGREFKRNQHRTKFDVFYEPLSAHAKAKKRQTRAWEAKHPLKNKKVFEYVINKLKTGWSPEQISGRLKHIEYPNNPDWHICAETIYQFIYRPCQKHHKYYEYLRRGHKKRRAKSGRKVHRSRIPDRVSIHQRPIVVDRRKQPGHWEGDTVVGKGRDHGLHTAYERVSSYLRFALMERLDAESSIKAQLKIYSTYPQSLRRTVTLDNGKEHVKHKLLEEKLGIQTYFADPYSSWQRGGNENANQWLRYYFPKRTNFRTIHPGELEAVEWELNNRPRKRLNFKTPQEVFSQFL